MKAAFINQTGGPEVIQYGEAAAVALVGITAGGDNCGNSLKKVPSSTAEIECD